MGSVCYTCNKQRRYIHYVSTGEEATLCSLHGIPLSLTGAPLLVKAAHPHLMVPSIHPEQTTLSLVARRESMD